MAGLLDPPLGDGDHVTGAPGADLELVMYGDFQCPYCAAAQGPVRRVRERLGDRLRFAFRHFPIPELHPDAQRAAEAAEAAGDQGAFWPMHDALYASGGRLGEGKIVAAADALGLDAERLRAELRAGAHAPRVARDVESGRRSGVTGTPSFFANGRLVEGSFDAGSLVEALTA
ncbi:MAG: Na+:H+ antiporter, NhaA family [Solirubrobacteraceae bacterium]|nr:Na+:H+ antiporter, NhaA family [Solirubrobacteraceae bacterium]